MLTGLILLTFLLASPLAMAGSSRHQSPGNSQTSAKDEAAKKLANAREEIEAAWAEHKRAIEESGGPRSGLGAIYARYSTKFQDSIGDQIRTCLEKATSLRILVPREHIYFDAGISGTKSRREGFGAFKDALERKAVGTVLFFSSSRMFRKQYLAEQFVEERLLEKGIRVIFVSNNADSQDEAVFRQLFKANAGNDEHTGRANVEQIRSSQIGKMTKGYVFGTIPFGYTGEVVAGEVTRRGLPRRKIVIDEAEAAIVRTIFSEFAHNHVGYCELVRRLNANSNGVRGRKNRTGLWSVVAVKNVLQNSRYRGRLIYGETEGKLLTSKDYVRQVPRKAPLRIIEREDLRIISEELWASVQARLLAGQSMTTGGRRPDPDKPPMPRVIGGLLYCSAHGQMMYAKGTGGQYFRCKTCLALPRSERPLYSDLPRLTALKILCAFLARALRDDEAMIRLVIDATKRHAEALQQPDPGQRRELERENEKLDRKIKFILDTAGEENVDRDESTRALKEARARRAAIYSRIETLKAAESKPVLVPTEAEVRALLASLGTLLSSYAITSDQFINGHVRRLIDLMTGGRIEVEQAGERAKYRGWIRGRFRLRVVETVFTQLIGADVFPDSAMGLEVVIDFKRAPGTVAPARREEILRRYHAKEMIESIKRNLRIARETVVAVIRDWHDEQGLPVPDARARRWELDRARLGHRQHEKIVDDVKRLIDERMKLQDIAVRLGVLRKYVTKAWQLWHTSRGLPVPDGRGRRKEFPRERRHPKKDVR